MSAYRRGRSGLSGRNQAHRPVAGSTLSTASTQSTPSTFVRTLIVSCPINNVAFAAGQLAVFQGASEAPIYLVHTGRASNAEKQPTGHGPEGCDENGPAAALLVGYVSI